MRRRQARIGNENILKSTELALRGVRIYATAQLWTAAYSTKHCKRLFSPSGIPTGTREYPCWYLRVPLLVPESTPAGTWEYPYWYLRVPLLVPESTPASTQEYPCWYPRVPLLRIPLLVPESTPAGTQEYPCWYPRVPLLRVPLLVPESTAAGTQEYPGWYPRVPLLVPESIPAGSLHPAGIQLVSKKLLEYTNSPKLGKIMRMCKQCVPDSLSLSRSLPYTIKESLGIEANTTYQQPVWCCCHHRRYVPVADLRTWPCMTFPVQAHAIINDQTIISLWS